MDQEGLQKVVYAIKEKHPNLRHIHPDELTIFHDKFLGGGGFCDAYRATVEGWSADEPIVCAKIIKCKKKADIMDEMDVIPRTDKHVLGAHGWSSHCGTDNKHRIVLVLPLCSAGDLDEFQDNEPNELSLTLKVSIMKQVLRGLEQLKKQRIIWRDLKGQNILITKLERNEKREVRSMDVMLTDWGCAVQLLKNSDRRMTLYGPGTGGFIAPDTSSPSYDYQVDMWAWLVWAASLCLEPKRLDSKPLEDRLEDLALEKKPIAYKLAEKKVRAVLDGVEGAVLEEMRPLWTLLRSVVWCSPDERWTPQKAKSALKEWARQLKSARKAAKSAAASAAAAGGGAAGWADDDVDDDEAPLDDGIVSPRSKAPAKEPRQHEPTEGLVSPPPPGKGRKRARAEGVDPLPMADTENVIGAGAGAGGGGGEGPATAPAAGGGAPARRVGADGSYETCGGCLKRGRLMLCDGHRGGVPCPEAMHIKCAGLKAKPKGDWYCSKCFFFGEKLRAEKEDRSRAPLREVGNTAGGVPVVGKAAGKAAEEGKRRGSRGGDKRECAEATV